MIKDSEALDEIRRSWRGATSLRDRVQRALLGSIGSAPFALTLGDFAYNLPFLHACAVLNDVLRQLRDERQIACTSNFLGALREASKDTLPWLDFEGMGTVVMRRNELAHDGVTLARGECWQHFDAIERQLKRWGVV